ncbi:MAG: hypothetical protein ACXVZW_02475, partial [Gaiellaceae bacterium]
MRLSICAAFQVVLAFGVSAGYPSPAAGPRVGQRDANARGITNAGATAAHVGHPGPDYGTQTFAQLGIGDVHYTFPPPQFDRKPVFTLQFPPHAREGGKNWWILHLHVTVGLSSEPKGEAAVGVSVNQ